MDYKWSQLHTVKAWDCYLLLASASLLILLIFQGKLLREREIQIYEQVYLTSGESVLL